MIAGFGQAASRGVTAQPARASAIAKRGSNANESKIEPHKLAHYRHAWLLLTTSQRARNEVSPRSGVRHCERACARPSRPAQRVMREPPETKKSVIEPKLRRTFAANFPRAVDYLGTSSVNVH